MRYPLLLALLLAGCAYTPAEVMQAQRAERDALRRSLAERQPTADSLAALPPDSLGASEAAWLQAYQSDRTRADALAREQGQARRSDSNADALGLVAVVLLAAAGGAAVYFLLLKE